MSLADEIERHLLTLLAQTVDGALEIRRNALSEIFGCSPSQINYVLETRFTDARGFLVQSRRGGAGFVRILRLEPPPAVRELLDGFVGESISQERAVHLVERMEAAGWLSGREAAMLTAALDRQHLDTPLPERDRLRARLLRAMILSLYRAEAGRPAAGGTRHAL